MIAIGAMLIDHLAWSFVNTYSWRGQIMHFLGRITAPVMCFFIAEGYHYTRSLPRYLQRLAVFASLSQIPFTLFAVGKIALIPLNVIYTLFLGLAAIYSYDTIEDKLKRNLVILGIIILSLPADWTFLAPLLCLLFHIYRGDLLTQAGVLTALALALGVSPVFLNALGYAGIWWDSLFHLGIILNIPLLYLYNGQKGGSKYSRWFFYIFYPVHLLILGLLRW